MVRLIMGHWMELFIAKQQGKCWRNCPGFFLKNDCGKNFIVLCKEKFLDLLLQSINHLQALETRENGKHRPQILDFNFLRVWNSFQLFVSNYFCWLLTSCYTPSNVVSKKSKFNDQISHNPLFPLKITKILSRVRKIYLNIKLDKILRWNLILLCAALKHSFVYR